MSSYPIPKQTTRVEYIVDKSRFIGTIGRADTVAEAKAFIKNIRAEMPDASHHVYAFIVGFGASVTEGKSDDGEPSGTAGPPSLAVLRGSGIGDVVLVTTRYFGGKKLGTGGLVHAYGQTAKDAVASLKTELKVERVTIGIEIPYSLYDRVKLMLPDYEAILDDEDFAGEITLIMRIPVENLSPLRDALRELSAGQVEPMVLDD